MNKHDVWRDWGGLQHHVRKRKGQHPELACGVRMEHDGSRPGRYVDVASGNVTCTSCISVGE